MIESNRPMTQPTFASPPDLMAHLARMESFLKSDPGNRELLATVIDLRLAARQPEQAQQGVDAALALFPGDPFFTARAGNVLIATGQWAKAGALFAPLLAAQPDVHLAYNLAYCWYWLGRYAEAEAVLAPYAASPETGSEAVTLLLRVQHHLGRFADALALIEARFEQCKGDPDFLGAASLLHMDEGLEQSAAQLSALSLGSGQRTIESLVVAGMMALSRTQPDQAIALFLEVLAKKPGDARSWSGLGMASLSKGDVQNALVQLGQAYKLMPNDIGTLHGLAWCKILLRDLAGAETLVQTALTADPSYTESHGAVAVIAAMRGERALAEAALARVDALGGGSHAADYARRLLSGQHPEAMQFEPLAMRLLSSRKGMPIAEEGAAPYAARKHMPRPR
jgi:Flp pilus assembly protein TadD